MIWPDYDISKGRRRRMAATQNGAPDCSGAPLVFKRSAYSAGVASAEPTPAFARRLSFHMALISADHKRQDHTPDDAVLDACFLLTTGHDGVHHQDARVGGGHKERHDQDHTHDCNGRQEATRDHVAECHEQLVRVGCADDCAFAASVSGGSAAASPSRPATKPSYDPQAP